jgi:hypothetical protein
MRWVMRLTRLARIVLTMYRQEQQQWSNRGGDGVVRQLVSGGSGGAWQ